MLQPLSDAEEGARQSVINFINTHVPEKFQKKFRNRFKFNKKEPTLSERLKDLFNGIDEANQTKIFTDNIDREDLITKLTQTRNYHTHGDSKNKYPKMITDINEMYKTKVLLQEVLRYYIYQTLEMEYEYKNY